MLAGHIWPKWLHRKWGPWLGQAPVPTCPPMPHASKQTAKKTVKSTQKRKEASSPTEDTAPTQPRQAKVTRVSGTPEIDAVPAALSQTRTEQSVPLTGGTERSAHHSTHDNVITDGDSNTATNPGAAESPDAKNSKEELSERPFLWQYCSAH